MQAVLCSLLKWICDLVRGVLEMRGARVAVRWPYQTLRASVSLQACNRMLLYTLLFKIAWEARHDGA